MPLAEPITLTKKILSTFFQTSIHETIVDKGNGTFTLSPKYSTYETNDNKGSYTLWNFPIKEELQNVWNQFPIYFAFNIKLKPNEEIAEVNIKLFKEDTKTTSDTTTICLQNFYYELNGVMSYNLMMDVSMHNRIGIFIHIQ